MLGYLSNSGKDTSISFLGGIDDICLKIIMAPHDQEFYQSASRIHCKVQPKILIKGLDVDFDKQFGLEWINYGGLLSLFGALYYFHQ